MTDHTSQLICLTECPSLLLFLKIFCVSYPSRQNRFRNRFYSAVVACSSRSAWPCEDEKAGEEQKTAGQATVEVLGKAEPAGDPNVGLLSRLLNLLSFLYFLVR